MRSIFGNVFETRPVSKTQNTTDATATTVYSALLAEEQTISITVKGTVRSSDGAINGSFLTTGVYYRNTAGNVTAVNAAQHDIFTDYTGGATAEVTLVINTTTQAIDIKVTGQTSVNFQWNLDISGIKVSY